jgi:hypothetical protein
MLQDSDSEGEEDDEGEGEDSWDLGDDGVSHCCLFNCVIQSSPVLDPDDFQRFQTTTCVAAAQRSEGNQCIGGMKSQKSMVKIWNVHLNLSVPCVGGPRPDGVCYLNSSSSTRHASNSRFEMT